MALVLHRKEKGTICIGPDITVTVGEFFINHRTGEQHVRLSIEAPAYMSVDRKEVRESRIKKVEKVIGNRV